MCIFGGKGNESGLSVRIFGGVARISEPPPSRLHARQRIHKTPVRVLLAMTQRAGNCGKTEKNSPPCFGRFTPAKGAVRTAGRHKTRFLASGEGNKFPEKYLRILDFVLILQPENKEITLKNQTPIEENSTLD